MFNLAPSNGWLNKAVQYHQTDGSRSCAFKRILCYRTRMTPLCGGNVWNTAEFRTKGLLSLARTFEHQELCFGNDYFVKRLHLPNLLQNRHEYLDIRRSIQSWMCFGSSDKHGQIYSYICCLLTLSLYVFEDVQK